MMAPGLQLSIVAKNKDFFVLNFSADGVILSLFAKKEKNLQNFHFVVRMAFFVCVKVNLTTTGVLNHDKVYYNTNSLQ